jgi:hypothetical protein
MKYLALICLAALGLASCSEDESTPTPERITRTAQTVTLTYARTASSIVGDTLLQNPRLDVYLLRPTMNENGTMTYPTTTGATPNFSITDFSNPQPLTLATNLSVGSQPDLGVRVVMTTSNRPGRRANSQRLTASLLINGTSRVSFTHTGLNFSRTATPINGVFTTTGDANVAAYLF